jgi:TolA-binding protein
VDKLENQFHDLIERMGSYVQQNRSQLAKLLVMVVVLAGLMGGWLIWAHQHEKKALQAQYGIEKLEEKFFKEFPPSYASLTDEQKKELEGAYEEALKKYGNSQNGRFIHYKYASLLVEKKEYAQAQGHFEAFKKHFGNNSPYRSLALGQLAYCSVQMKQFEQARKYLMESLVSLANPSKDQTLFELAKVEEKLGNIDKARSHYEELIKDHDQSPMVEKARERKELLAQGQRVEGKEQARSENPVGVQD